MNFVFLMDPLETVILEKDTSFILMWGAHRRGHKIFFVPDGGMTLEDGRLRFLVQQVTPRHHREFPFVREGAPAVLMPEAVSAVFVRSDPPFDAQYLLNTWMLDRLPPDVVVINRPSGIRTVNEKIWATQFTDFIPPTLVGRQRADLISFVRNHGDVIAKPTDSFGGQGVFRISPGDPNVNGILEHLTVKYTHDIILQRYVPDAVKGDKRIILLNGEPLGAVLRVHTDDDFRNNFFAGGKPAATTITDRDREIIAALKPHLQELGLHFVGIDIMGDYLIEVNVTSPTCLQEINALTGEALEERVIEYVEGLCGK